MSATALIAPVANAAPAPGAGAEADADPQMCPSWSQAGCTVATTFGKALHTVRDLYDGSSYSDTEDSA
ncbi:hypothetical protein K2224_33535 (plasmid) [Streptomyces sp. BHT-5-2]|uniref:hypothetical protein n=1 Tax=unclassified Streptomyces TaxID=2593676 RepID=UPI001C8ED14C|nr:hypothetical protein [Streptomyces sp. BHT-5-2]QZL08081.1 hypothetical protein K2224_33535 [Streptomyces sp. BHT-5-2]